MSDCHAFSVMLRDLHFLIGGREEWFPVIELWRSLQGYSHVIMSIIIEYLGSGIGLTMLNIISFIRSEFIILVWWDVIRDLIRFLVIGIERGNNLYSVKKVFWNLNSSCIHSLTFSFNKHLLKYSLPGSGLRARSQLYVVWTYYVPGAIPSAVSYYYHYYRWENKNMEKSKTYPRPESYHSGLDPHCLALEFHPLILHTMSHR